MPSRIASVWIPDVSEEAGRELTAALLEASPRVMRAATGLWRVDAAGWERRGGERGLARVLREAAGAAGAPGSRVGVADVPVAADAAARVAGEPEGSLEDPIRVVPAGESRGFLASLPPELLPVSEETLRTLRALGLRRIGQVADRPREEWEARFGPEGLRLHRWARGRDDRRLWFTRPEEQPEASVEVDGGVDGLEPLLFLLRHLVSRISDDLESRGRYARRLRIRLLLEGGDEETAQVSPARPTRRPELLLDLCRAALERRSRSGAGARIQGVALAVERMGRARARQGDLFTRRWRDPMQAAATLSRLRARLGQQGVAVPEPRRTHRPEDRNRWRPAESAGGSPRDDSRRAGPSSRSGPDGERREPRRSPEGTSPADAVPPVLRLLAEPRRVEVRTEDRAATGGGPPREVWDEEGRHEVVVAEGPERLSGDWWEDPYRREYYRVCTAEGELLWLFREYPESGRLRWWLHGWWD